MDNEIEMTPMPPEYRDFKAEILCKDCHEVGILQAIRYYYIFSKSARCDRVQAFFTGELDFNIGHLKIKLMKFHLK